MKETVDETVVVFAPRTGRSIWGTNRLWSLALALTRENSHSQVPTSMTVNTLWTCAATVSPSVARITAPAVANRQRHAVVLAAAATLIRLQIYRAQSHRVTKVVVQ